MTRLIPGLSWRKRVGGRNAWLNLSSGRIASGSVKVGPATLNAGVDGAVDLHVNLPGGLRYRRRLRRER